MTQVASIYKALTDDHRRKMVKLLGQQDRTVGELQQSLRISQSSTSQHSKLLQEAGLVSFRKHGNFRIQSLKIGALRIAMNYFDKLWDKSLSNLKTKLEHKK